MKRLIFILIITFLAPAGQSTARIFSQVTKEKKLSGHYNVQPSDRLVIENSYGKIHINTWNRDEISVDITVTVKAGSESAAQDVLDRISFVTEGNDNGRHKILYRTVIGRNKGNNKSSEMNIDYVINTPRKNAMDITNKYGDVYLDDFEGALDMDVAYGAFNAKNLTGSSKKIKVAFGSATMSSLITGKVDVSYSKLTIDEGGDIVVKNMFGKSNIASVQSLDIIQRYGDLSIGSVRQIEGSVDYADLTIDNLSKSADLTLKYCGKVEVGATNAVEMVRINSSFSSLYLMFGPNPNLAVDLSVSFGDMKNRLSRGFELSESKPSGNSNTTYYKGRWGSGSGALKLTASYGSVTFK